MNSIIISSTIEIPHLIIQELNYLQKEVIVHSIITKTISSAQHLYSSLHKDHQIQLDGLTYVKTEGFIIFVVALDTIEKPEVVLYFLYLISKYIHFEDKEMTEISKIYSTLPLISVQKYSPKINQQFNLKAFKLSKKNLKLAGKPKLIVRYRMTGILLLNIMLDYCELYNTNKQINENIFIRSFQRESLRRLDEVKNNQYYKQLVKIQSASKIQETEHIYDQFMNLQQQILLKLLDVLECVEIKSEIVSFLSRIKDNCHQVIKENNEKSSYFCRALLTQYLELFNAESENIADQTEQRNIFIKQQWVSLEEILENYLKDAEGPYKHQISQQVVSCIFLQQNKWYDSFNNQWASELNQQQVKQYLQQAIILHLQEMNEDLKNKLSESERKKLELKNQNQKSIYEQEVLQHQLEKLRIQNQNLELNYNRAKYKQKKYKEDLEKLEDEIQKLTFQLQQKKNELAHGQTKISLLQNALDSTVWQSSQENFEKELIIQTQILKEKIDQSTSQTILSFGTRQESELSQILVVDSLQAKYDKIREKRKQLKQEVSQIKEQNFILQRKEEEKETKIKNLINELSLRQSKEFQVSSEIAEIFQNHKKAIEQLNNKYSKLENDYYIKSIELQHLEYYRENSLAILRETLKLSMKKSNCLQSFLKQMPQDKQTQIKEILHYFNLKI